jgi:hypothetical protein
VKTSTPMTLSTSRPRSNASQLEASNTPGPV